MMIWKLIALKLLMAWEKTHAIRYLVELPFRSFPNVSPTPGDAAAERGPSEYERPTWREDGALVAAGQSGRVLDGFMYNPEDFTWSFIGSLTTDMAGCTLIVLDGKVRSLCDA